MCHFVGKLWELGKHWVGCCDPSDFIYNHCAYYEDNWLGRLFCLKVSYCWRQGQRFEPWGFWYGICVNTFGQESLVQGVWFHLQFIVTISARSLKAGNEARSRVVVVRVVGKCVGLSLSVGCCWLLCPRHSQSMEVWCGSDCCGVCCVEGGFEGKDGFGEDASLEAMPAVIWKQDLSMMGVVTLIT